jgi:signal transduction histidine kinase
MEVSHLPGEDGLPPAALAGVPEALSLADACDALFAAVAPYTGAVAAALAETEPPRVLAVWRCEPAQVRRLLTGTPAGAGPHPEPDLSVAAEPGTPAPLAEYAFDLADTGRAEAVRRVTLRPADGRTLLLMLFFPLDRVPDASQATQAGALAALATLLLERDFFADEARRAREARDHFLVAINHELRTPATAVMIEAGLLQSGLLGPLTPRLQGSLTRIETQLGELVRVVQRVLDLARLETAVEPPREDLLDPRDTVVTLARHVEPAATRKGVNLSLYFPRGLSLIQTDAERFRRILLCLLANAIKYTESGRVQVRVERGARAVAEGRREPLLMVRVVDTGRGIPAAELERIFEPFAQVEEGARTDSESRGVGLGLALARRLARSLGGEIEVQSTRGKGTTATLSLPYRAG